MTEHADLFKLNDKYLRLVGIPVSVTIVLLLQMHYYFPGRWDLFVRYTLFTMVFTALMWEIVRYILIRVRYRFPGLTQTKQRIAWTFFLFALQMGIGQGLVTWLVIYLKWSESPLSFGEIWLINFAFSLFCIVLIGGIYEAAYFFSQYKQAIQKSDRLKKDQAKQKLEALKNRVNPHFLFNSLTTLSALIGENAPRAERFVDELSKVYRHLLRAGRQPNMTLEEELDFAKSYTFLMENRFGENAFSFTVTPEADRNQYSSDNHTVLIPALSLQNVVDFIVRTRNMPLKIEAEMSDNCLQITCEGSPKTLAFDASDNDWRPLEAQGAWIETADNQLKINIPLLSNNAGK